jgi:hypothetical protein
LIDDQGGSGGFGNIKVWCGDHGREAYIVNRKLTLIIRSKRTLVSTNV